jgi:hypothetical protein
LALLSGSTRKASMEPSFVSRATVVSLMGAFPSMTDS